LSEFDDFRLGLLDNDGSCRDINFAPLALTDCSTIVHRLFALASGFSGHASNGDTLSFDPAAFIESAATIPSAHGVLNDVGGIFTQLQCFAGADHESAFLELTFFPKELVCSDDSLVTLVRFLNSLCLDTDISEYFVRYENASWEFGKTGNGTGVIFTRSQVATVA